MSEDGANHGGGGGGRDEGGQEDGGKSGGKKWKCPNPDCGKWCRGDVCSDCGTNVAVAKSMDRLKRDRRDDRRGGWGHGGGGRRHGGRGNRRDGGGGGRSRDSVQKISNSTCPIVHMFEGIREVLDARHDKMERIVKISRDITIESKRIIFTLHRIKSEQDKQHVLLEAEQRFNGMKKGLWRSLAMELKGEDHFQFLKNYTAGLQEWIEALSFYHYLCYDKLIGWEEVQKELVFQYFRRPKKNSGDKKIEDASSEDAVSENKEGTNDQSEVKSETESKETKEDAKGLPDSSQALPESSQEQPDPKQTPTEEAGNKDSQEQVDVKEDTAEKEETEEMIVTVPQNDYILGLADLTGELMRNAINSLSSGELDVCFVLLNLLQSMYNGFLMVQQDAPYQVSKKVYTLKQSLRKVEDACYAINVRGSEIPKSHLADIFNQRSENPDLDD